MSPNKNLIRQRFGRLIVTGKVGSKKSGKCWRVHWYCWCDCGNFVEPSTGALRSENTRSCGCLQRDRTSEAHQLEPFRAVYHTFLYRVNDRSLDVTLSFREFLGLTRITKCHYCGGHIRWSVYATKGTSFGYNLDRKDNTRGYHIDNVVVCCGRCNRVKGDNLTYDEMLLLSPALQEITRRRGIMGHGRVRDKNKLKKQFMQPLREYAEKLEKENKALKKVPNSVIGQFIGQYQELYSQNSRLSVLTACLLDRMQEEEKFGVVLTKAEMEAFKDQRINIKWELPEGVDKAEDADQYIFTYDVVPANQPMPTPMPATETPAVVDPELGDLTAEANPVIESDDDIEPLLAAVENQPDNEQPIILASHKG